MSSERHGCFNKYSIPAFMCATATFKLCIAAIWFYMQTSITLAVADGHLVNMGKMIE
jgi:hypothetical protein